MKIITTILFIFSIMGLSFSNATGPWTDATFKKIEVSSKYTEDYTFSIYMMVKCKKSKNPQWCYEVINHAGWHETKWGTVSDRNVFGMLKYNYIQDKYKAVDMFIEKYNRYWYSNDCSKMVYLSLYTLTQKQERVSNCHWMQSNLDVE